MALELQTSAPRFNEALVAEKVARTIFNRKWNSELIQYTRRDLEAMTYNFKEENLIGMTTYGKVYRGNMKLDSAGAETKDVIVKIWDDDAPDDGKVLEEEVRFLTHDSMNHHPNLVKVIAICKEGKYLVDHGIVYDLNPLDSLYNLIPTDNFSWKMRIKVALEFAKLVEFLHGGVEGQFPYVVLSIDSKIIMIDQEYNPILIDFALLTGGRMGGQRFSQYSGSLLLDYCDPHHLKTGRRPETVNDVYAYGMILLGLLAKRVDKKEDIYVKGYETMEKWARRVCNPSSSSSCNDCSSLVHPSLKEDEYYDESDGMALTELVMKCIQVGKPYERPHMTDVVNCLKNLYAFQPGCSRKGQSCL